MSDGMTERERNDHYAPRVCLTMPVRGRFALEPWAMDKVDNMRTAWIAKAHKMWSESNAAQYVPPEAL